MIFQVTLSGSGCFRWEGQTHRVTPGQAMIVVVPEESSYFYPSDGSEAWEFVWINFRGSQAIELWRWIRQTYGPLVSLPPLSPAMELLRGLLHETTGTGKVDEFRLSSDAYRFVMALAGQLEASLAGRRSPIREIIYLMERQPSRPLAVKELADRAGMSREHFTRQFVRETGLSPAAYRRERQLQMAADWLLRSDMTVQDIAERCGFQGGRELTKAFRRYRDKSPLEYREMVRSETAQYRSKSAR